jgi:hypothetical protein
VGFLVTTHDEALAEGMRRAREGSERAQLRQDVDNARGELRRAAELVIVLRSAFPSGERVKADQFAAHRKARDRAEAEHLDAARRWTQAADTYDAAMKAEVERMTGAPEIEEPSS